MTTDQYAADRERIAGEMKSRGAPPCLEVAPTIDAAIRAFEVLCEPRYELGREDGRWYAAGPEAGKAGNHWRTRSIATGNHAADVCRLVCEVLDREAKESRP